VLKAPPVQDDNDERAEKALDRPLRIDPADNFESAVPVRLPLKGGECSAAAMWTGVSQTLLDVPACRKEASGSTGATFREREVLPVVS